MYMHTIRSNQFAINFAMNIGFYSWMKNPRNYSMWKDVQFSNCIIVMKMVTNLKRRWIIIKMLKHSYKQLIVAHGIISW